MDSAKSFFIKLDECIVAFQRYSAAYIYLITLVLVMLGVITRNVFQFSFAWPEELGKILMIWVAAMGAALATRKNEHVCVDLIFRFIPLKLLPCFKGFLGAVNTGFVGLFTYYTFRHAIVISKTGQVSTGMDWFQMYWVYAILGICFLMMTIEFCRWTINIVRYKPTNKELPKERE